MERAEAGSVNRQHLHGNALVCSPGLDRFGHTAGVRGQILDTHLLRVRAVRSGTGPSHGAVFP